MEYTLEKTTMKCRIAELNVEIINRGSHIRRISAGYEADFSHPDILLSASDEDVQREIENGSGPFAETVAFSRKFGQALPRFDGFMMHAATFTVGDKCIALMAKSGTGKSTHMLLWKQLFGENMEIINGDKPAVKIVDGKPFAYGTPWCGKEGLSVNKGAQLTDLCFIRRSEQNSVAKLPKQDCLKFLLGQVVIPEGSENIIKLMELLDKMLQNCNVWEIFCNTDISAAELSSRTILR